MQAWPRTAGQQSSNTYTREDQELLGGALLLLQAILFFSRCCESLCYRKQGRQARQGKCVLFSKKKIRCNLCRICYLISQPELPYGDEEMRSQFIILPIAQRSFPSSCLQLGKAACMHRSSRCFMALAKDGRWQSNAGEITWSESLLQLKVAWVSPMKLWSPEEHYKAKSFLWKWLLAREALLAHLPHFSDCPLTPNKPSLSHLTPSSHEAVRMLSWFTVQQSSAFKELPSCGVTKKHPKDPSNSHFSHKSHTRRLPAGTRCFPGDSTAQTASRSIFCGKLCRAGMPPAPQVLCLSVLLPWGRGEPPVFTSHSGISE